MSDDISQAPPPQPVAWRKEGQQQGGGFGHGGRNFARAADAYERLSDEGLDVDDTVWVQGIPPEDLTPPVRRAIGALMAEVEHLRQQLDARPGGPMPAPHGLESPADAAVPEYLADDECRSDSDAEETVGVGAVPASDPVGILSADDLDALLRVRLDVLMDGGPAPAVVSLSLANEENLADHHGAAAARLAVATMAEAVAAVRMREEVVGHTAAGPLAVVLPFDGQVDRLWRRARALAHAAEVTASWRGHDLRVHVLLGVHACAKGEAPSDALDQAAAGARRVV